MKSKRDHSDPSERTVYASKLSLFAETLLIQQENCPSDFNKLSGVQIWENSIY